MPCKASEQYPPPFLEHSLSGDDSTDSGHNPSLDGSAKNAVGPNESRGDLELNDRIAKQGFILGMETRDSL